MKRTDKTAVQADRNVWGERYGRELDAEELRQLRENLLEFLNLLQEWAAKAGEDDAADQEAPEPES
jgi:hypothetical protein